jgi:hypothetical protein
MQYWNIKNKIQTLLFAFSMFSTVLNAQENSPYSRYGVGNIKQLENIAFRGMGGVSIADDNPLIANPTNPATYTGLRMTSYQVGIEGNLVTIKNSLTSNRTGSNNLSYANIGFPIRKNMGFSFGLIPLTRSKYSMQQTSAIQNVDENITTDYYGGGGLQKIYFGLAYKYSDFSVGFNSGYTFGNLVNTTETTFTDSLQIFSNNITSRKVMGGFFWQLGGLYSKELQDDYKIRIGATYTGSQSLNAKKESYWQSFVGDVSSPTYVYKVDSVINKKGKVVLPSNLGLGVNFAKGDYWQIGVDYTASDWSKYSSYGTSDSLSNSWMLKFGGAITPDVNSVNNYWKKMTYRMGVYTGQDIIQLKSSNLKRSGITFGLGYPIRRTNLSIGQINASLEVGKRGTIDNGLVREGYTRFAIGFTFNDKWFIKRRYD